MLEIRRAMAAFILMTGPVWAINCASQSNRAQTADGFRVGDCVFPMYKGGIDPRKLEPPKHGIMYAVILEQWSMKELFSIVRSYEDLELCGVILKRDAVRRGQLGSSTRAVVRLWHVDGARKSVVEAERLGRSNRILVQVWVER